MSMNQKTTHGLMTAAGAALPSGCNTTQPKSDLASRLEVAQQANSELRSSHAVPEQSVANRDQRIASLHNQPAGAGDLLPSSAKPGECCARAFVPPQCKPVSKTVVKREAGERVETDPARYEWVEEKVLVEEASQEIEVVPARYGWKEEQVLVKEASNKLVVVPAAYQTVKVRKLAESAKERRIAVPADYQEVSDQVMVSKSHLEWRRSPAIRRPTAWPPVS